MRISAVAAIVSSVLGLSLGTGAAPALANSFVYGDIVIPVGTQTSAVTLIPADETSYINGSVYLGLDPLFWGDVIVTAPNGLLSVSDDFKQDPGEKLTIQGSFNSQALTTLSASGTFITDTTGTSVFNSLVLGTGGNNTVRSGGSETGTSLTVSQNASHTVQTNAESNWQTVEISGTANVNAEVNWDQTTITETGQMNVSGDYKIAEGQQVNNAGTLNASSLSELSVSGTLVTENGGSGQYQKIVLESGATATTQSGGTETGTALAIKARASHTAEAGATLNFKTVDIAVSGTLNNNGQLTADEVTVEGTMTGTGEIHGTANGTLTVEAGAALTQQTVDVKTFTNKGASTLGDVSNFGSDHTLIMSGPTAQVTVTNGTWFNNTNLVYEKGAVITAADLNASGEFGANTVTIRGDANPAITAGKPNTATFNGMTTVTVDKLKAETDVTIEAGGRLIVGELDSNGVNATLDGGVIEVDSSNLLKPSQDYQAYLMNATDGSGAYSGTSNIIHNVYGYIYDGTPLSGIALNSGVVSLTSQSPMQQPLIMTIVRGIGNAVTTVFNGSVIPSTTAAGTLTPTQVAEFFVEQSNIAQVPVLNPGIVLVQYHLVGTDESKAITFGTTGDIRRSIGFSAVRNAAGIVINDGLETALVGTEALTAESPVDFSNAATQLVGSVTVNKGTFTVGSAAAYDYNTGWIDSISVASNEGSVRFQKGIWGVKNGFSSAGAVSVASTASLTIPKESAFAFADATGNAASSIAGTVSIASDNSSSDVYLGTGHTIDISGLFSTGGRNTQSAATVNLSGTATYADLALKSGAAHKVTQTGIESGDELTVNDGAKLTVEAGGSSTWNDVTINGSASVAGLVYWKDTEIGITGRLTVADGFSVAETQTITNAGLFDSTAVALEVYGNIETATFGTSRYGDMTLKQGASNTVKEGGAEQCGTLVVEQGATQTVEKGATSKWNVVNLAGNAVVAANTEWLETNIKETGSLTATQDFAIETGETIYVEGEFDATGITNLTSSGKVVTMGGVSSYQNLTLESGAQHELQDGIEVGKVLTLNSGASYSTENAAVDASAIWDGLAMNGGSATIRLSNFTASELTLTDGSLTILPNRSSDAVDPGAARLTIGTSVPLAVNNASVLVGSLSTGDSAPAAGSVYFGADSILEVNASALSTTTSAIRGNGSGSITVKKGSGLMVNGATWGKHYLVADSFGTINMENGAWSSEYVVTDTGDNAYAKVLGKAIVLHVGNADGDTSIEALSKDYVAPKVIDSLINNIDNLPLRDANSDAADISFIERMIDKDYIGSKDGKLDTEASSRAINSALALSAASGVDAYAAQTTFTQMERLSSIMSGSDYASRRRKPDDALWVKLIGNQSKTTKLAFGNGKAGFKATEYGIMAGGDWAMDRQNRIGLSAHYISADLKSRGDTTSTKTDAKSMGLAIYGVHDIGRIRLSGQFGYSTTKGEISQTLSDRKKNTYSIKGNTEAKTLSIGARAEVVLPTPVCDIVPHVGMNLAYTKHKAVKTRINGKEAFSGKTKDTHLVQAPIGVSVRSAIRTRRGLSIQPYADFTIAPQFGKKKAKATVSAVSYNGSDSYSYGIVENRVSRLMAGVNIASRDHAFSVSYTSEKGGSGRTAQGIMARYKYSF